MTKQYNENFTAENYSEELLMLAGRVEAVGAYLENATYTDKEVIAKMLGIRLGDKNEKV